MRVVRKLKEVCGLTKSFGLVYGFSYFKNSIFKSQKYKTRLKAIKILDKKFGYVFKECYNADYKIPAVAEDQKNIFVFWAQGFDKLPTLQQEVVKRLETLYPDYHLFKIDINNYSDYITLEEHVIKLFNSGKITIQTFSDILRFNFLWQIGGAWVDSTLLFFDRIEFDKMIAQNGFWSINHKSDIQQQIWGKVYPVTFTSFLLAAHKGNDIAKACSRFYNEYYKFYNVAIDYFMIDYALILCTEYNLCNSALKKINFNREAPFYLAEMLNGGGMEVNMEKLKACPQKLNWRYVDEDKLKTYLNKTI